MLNAFASLKYSIKCQRNVQKPVLSAFGDIVCLFVCLFLFFFFYRGRRFAGMQLNVKFLRKEEMLPQND